MKHPKRNGRRRNRRRLRRPDKHRKHPKGLARNLIDYSRLLESRKKKDNEDE